MPADVRLEVANGSLSVVFPAGSSIATGKHSIYFLNVLGFEPLLTPELGYQIPLEPSRQELVAQIASYLTQHGIPFHYEGTAGAIAARFKNSQEDLEQARACGARMKRTRVKVRKLTIPGFARNLMPYQTPAAIHAVEVRNTANFSVPGSGKTTVALAAYSMWKSQDVLDRLVVIGPRACFMPWEEEYEACFGRPPLTIRISGARDQRKQLYGNVAGADLILISYQMASNDLDDLSLLLQNCRALLVLDESHNIKKIEGGRWAEAVLTLSPFATRRMILSGTPAPNSLLDLWTQFTFLWPESPLLGPRDQYRLSVEEEEVKLRTVKNTVKPFFWRVKKSDLRLPVPTFHRVPVEMHKYQRNIYDAIGSRVLKDSIRAPIDRIKLRVWRRAKMIRLLQTASNPSLLAEYSTEFRIPPLDASDLPIDQLIEHYSDFETPAKLECAATLARQIVRKGQKVLLWTTFVHNIRTLETLLRDLSPLSIFGEVPKDDDEDDEHNRELIIRQFRTSASASILIANPGACAESVSLHKVCKHAVYLDRTFNGAQYMQSLDRIHRVGLGSRDRVHYYILEAKDSIDAVVDSRLEEKRSRMLRLLDDDMPVMNLDVEAGDVSEGDTAEADFFAVVAQLKKDYGSGNRGRQHR